MCPPTPGTLGTTRPSGGDAIGQRERAMNEYQKAIETKDDTSGAVQQAQEYMKKPYSGEPTRSPGT